MQRPHPLIDMQPNPFQWTGVQNAHNMSKDDNIVVEMLSISIYIHDWAHLVIELLFHVFTYHPKLSTFSTFAPLPSDVFVHIYIYNMYDVPI